MKAEKKVFISFENILYVVEVRIVVRQIFCENRAFDKVNVLFQVSQTKRVLKKFAKVFQEKK